MLTMQKRKGWMHPVHHKVILTTGYKRLSHETGQIQDIVIL